MWSGLLAGGLPCGLLFAVALADAAPVSRLALYAALVLVYLGLLLAICIPSALSRWIWRRLWVFLLAIGWRRANGHGAFVGLIAGMTAVGYIETFTDIEFLWLNVVGAVAVFVVGVIASAVFPGRR